MSTRTWVAAALLILPCRLPAQDASLNVFLPERSYAALGSPTVKGAPAYYSQDAEPSLLAEAQLVTHFALRRGLLQQEISEGTSNGVNFNLFLTTQFRVRGLRVPSGPVRSPSFMPRFTGQLLWTRGTPEHPTTGPRSIRGFNMTLGHHSNGGDGCVFIDESIGPDGACVSELPDGTSADKRRVRAQFGNFSTNYAEIGAVNRWGRVSDKGGGVYWTHFIDVGIVYQYNHDIGFPLPGGAEDAFADLYGRSRLRIESEGMLLLLGRSTMFRGHARLEAWCPKHDTYPGADNRRIELELSIQPAGDPAATSRLARAWAWMRLIGLGVRYVRGQDYYNTQFVRDIKALQWVLFVDPWSPFLQR